MKADEVRSGPSLASAAGSYLWRGPSFMSRMAGQETRIAPSETEHKMKKVMGLFHLTMMSTAAIIGTGIFVLTGVVAHDHAGPSVIISYLVGGVVAMLCAMAYMEFAAETNTVGASITYTCKIFGKLVAWLVAINVLMELVIASAAVANGFSGYFGKLIKLLDDAGPKRLTSFSGKLAVSTGGGSPPTVDPVAAATVLLIMLLLVLGVQEAAWLNDFTTSLCIITIIMTIIVGGLYINPANFRGCVPTAVGTVCNGFAPNGFNGLFRGASMVFFAYLGFEMMATAPEDSVNAARDVPLGIAISVAGCTILYVLMAMVIAGMVPYTEINTNAPFAAVFDARGVHWMAIVVCFGSVCGILDTIVVTQYSMSRVFVVLGRMGLVPPLLSRVNPRTHAPIFSVVFCGLVSAVLALLVDLDTLSNLTSMGALFAFCVVSAGVLFRRYYQPPSAFANNLPGLTGRQPAPLWKTLTLLLLIVGSGLGLGFGYATGRHWGLYVAMGALWFVCTACFWVFMPVVFKPLKFGTPLFPWWPSAGIMATIFLIAVLGPENWARWGYGCIIGVGLFGLYGLCEYLYVKRYGPPPTNPDTDELAAGDVAGAEAATDGSQGVKGGLHYSSGGSYDVEQGQVAGASGKGNGAQDKAFGAAIKDTKVPDQLAAGPAF